MASTKQLQWLNTACLISLAVLVLLPLLVPGLKSLESSAITGHASTLGWTNYLQIGQQKNFWRAFLNSVGIATVVTGLQVVTGALGGYALARFSFWGRGALLALLLAALAVPFPLLVIPTFVVLKTGHLLNTYAALILPAATSSFGIFLFRQHFLSLPVDLEAAASLDGANRWQILWYLVFPLARPAAIAVGLFAFIGEWNDLFKPLIFTTRPELMTLQLALAGLQEQYTNDWGLLMAGCVIATLPLVILFLLIQRQFMAGISYSGMKN
ncbi:MAG: carbohydrate ABC transporter permease [Cyanobacteria bacterium P01_H01_bin.15]